MLSFKIKLVEFPPFSGGEQRLFTQVRFPFRVRTAEACIRGFSVKYTNADHHLHQLEIFLSEQVGIDGREVSFFIYFLLRDFSGNVDDKYEGEIEVLVIADIDESNIAPVIEPVVNREERLR